MIAPFFCPRCGWVGPSTRASSGDYQKVSYLDSGKGRRWDLNGNDIPAALVELGLDYTTFNIKDTSMGVYARGRAEIWAGDRGTS